MIVAAFDIGSKNFAFCIRERENDKTLLLENLDLTIDTEDFNDILLNLIDEMDRRKEHWNRCDIFLIEKQMHFRGKYNVKALKIAQHLLTYLLMNYKKTKEIIDYPAFHKTKVLDAPKKMTKPQRKKWAVEKALELLEKTEPNYYNMIKKAKKKDDLADVYLMVSALFIQRNV